MFKNKTLLITGGTGSFGNAVLKKFVMSISMKLGFLVETRKQDDLRKKKSLIKLSFYW